MAFRSGGIQTQLWFGSGLGGDITINTNLTIAGGDINCENLTLDAGGGSITINTAGFRIFVKNKLHVLGDVAIANNGLVGGTAGGSGGIAGLGAPGATLAQGLDGGAGAAAFGNGTDAGGGSDSLGGSGGNGGVVSPLIAGLGAVTGYNFAVNGDPYNSWMMMSGGSVLTPSGIMQFTPGGGGGGGSGGNVSGARGGGGGGGGGSIFIAAGEIVVDAAANLIIYATGGAGGNGTAATAGCGGGGGGGGVIVLCYGRKTVGAGGFFNALPDGGNGGNSPTGPSGSGGAGGSAGALIEINETAFVVTAGNNGTPGTP